MPSASGQPAGASRGGREGAGAGRPAPRAGASPSACFRQNRMTQGDPRLRIATAGAYSGPSLCGWNSRGGRAGGGRPAEEGTGLGAAGGAAGACALAAASAAAAIPARRALAPAARGRAGRVGVGGRGRGAQPHQDALARPVRIDQHVVGAAQRRELRHVAAGARRQRREPRRQRGGQQVALGVHRAAVVLQAAARQLRRRRGGAAAAAAARRSRSSRLCGELGGRGGVPGPPRRGRAPTCTHACCDDRIWRASEASSASVTYSGTRNRSLRSCGGAPRSRKRSRSSGMPPRGAARRAVDRHAAAERRRGRGAAAKKGAALRPDRC
jgi:hypothetical protein